MAGQDRNVAQCRSFQPPALHDTASLCTVTAATTDSTAIVMSEGTSRGFPLSVTDAALGASSASAALYQVLHTNTGYVGTLVTESDTAATFQYVSQCANRGTCDSSTGICKCFKGYSNDNCDNQNMLAM